MLAKSINPILGKYRGIVVSILLFLLLDASVLIMNFYISFSISDDASAVNLAGRQRMLSQRMTKALFDIQYSQSDETSLNKAVDELVLTRNLFDSTLLAFDRGAEVKGADGQPVYISAVSDAQAMSAVKETLQIWQSYKASIDEIIANRSDMAASNIDLAAAISFAKSKNLLMLKNMNALTVKLEQIASQRATTLRLIQTAGMLLAITNFFIIMFHFLKQLRESDKAIEASRDETQQILDTVNEGLFLIDDQLYLGSQHSKILLEILGEDQIEGKSLKELLSSMVLPKDLEAVEGFVELLYKPKIKEKLIQDLNPLSQIQVKIEEQPGQFVSKYLAFEFARVYQNDAISHVLVTVNDITEKVALEHELLSLKEQENEQLEMLTSILHANGDLLQGFIQSSFTSFDKINAYLKEPAKSGLELKRKVVNILREMHRFKGEASTLKLEQFTQMAHDFESELQMLEERQKLSGNDFLGLTLKLDGMISYTQSIEVLLQKLAEFNQASAVDNVSSVNGAKADFHLHEYLASLCTQTGKKAELYCSGLNEYALAAEQQMLLNDITVQLLRNAMAHGVETCDARLQAQKADTARIDCHLTHTAKGELELVFSDDGGGINYEQIRAKARSMNKWPESQIESWDNTKLLSLIFTPGFSTAEETTELAGRGIGMDVIKDRINQAKGKLQIKTRRGLGTKFVVRLPKLVQSAQLA